MKLRKQIRGYEGLYQVRSDGAIISMLPKGLLDNEQDSEDLDLLFDGGEND